MPTIEERLQALEKEVAERKHSEEMLTIAVRALVSKEAFEKLQETVEQFQEQNGKLFNVIINQNALHNERLTNLQGQVIDLDSKLDGKVTVLDTKITGLQTEMRQGFAEIDQHFIELDQRFTRLDSAIAGLQTETHQRFTEQDNKITGLQTTQTEHTTLFHQILARLPEKPEEKSPGN